MADIKVSGLTAVAAFATTQEFPVNDSGTSKKITGAQIQAGLSRTRARGYRNAAQSLAGTGYQKILIDTASYDPSSGWDLVTNHRWTCPTGAGGYYLVTGGIAAAVTAGRLIANIYKNGSLYTQGNTDSGGSVSSAGSSAVSDVVPLVATDYLELWVYQNSGSPALSVGVTNVYLSIHFLSST